MASDRKFYHTTFMIKVISEYPIDEVEDLKHLDFLASMEGYAVKINQEKPIKINAPLAATLLIEYCTDPSKFGLTDEGEDIKKVA